MRLAECRYLPRDFHVRLVRLDRESLLGNLASHDGSRELADHGELIAEITVQRLKPIGELNHGIAVPVSDDIAVVDVHHVGRFDKRVIEVLVRRIEWVIDLERPTGLGDRS
jgi:hypothetical protein